MSVKPIGVGIIGVHPDKGWAATAHIPALRQLPAYRLTGVSHNNPMIATAAADKFGAEYAFSSTEKLVMHPDIDLVVVAVRVIEHKELLGMAIASGKAVFSEWPLGMNLGDAVTLRDLARSRSVVTAIGLQARATPVFSYVRDLIRGGYVGEVLSATMIGSGIIWGDTISDGFVYTLDPMNGAAMLNVPFAHSIDGLLHILDTRFETVAGTLVKRRRTIRNEVTGVELPMTVADQVLVTGVLASSTAISAHFRGGLSRGTNFHIEINGTMGDLIISSPVGYIGSGGFELKGARLDEKLHALEVPQIYGADRFEEGPAQGVAVAYERLASDMNTGTGLSPTFDDAVELHRLIDAIDLSEGAPVRV